VAGTLPLVRSSWQVGRYRPYPETGAYGKHNR
jgi:hypothetical protein